MSFPRLFAGFPFSSLSLAALLALLHLMAGTVVGAEPESLSLGGRMTGNGCFDGGRVAKSYIICVEKTSAAKSGTIEVLLKARAGYRDPVSDGGRFFDQAVVQLDFRLEDRADVFHDFGEVPVQLEVTVCTDAGGCQYSTLNEQVQLVRPYGYRMLEGTQSLTLLQDFAQGSTNRVVGVKVVIPGRPESFSFVF